MMERRYSVTIMASWRNGTRLIVGVTNHLGTRARFSTATGSARGSPRNTASRRSWYEHYVDVRDAIVREKQLKKWERR